MHKNTKIATCCYCGARTTLVLDAARHELCCAKCGAPLHDLKRLPSAKAPERPVARSAGAAVPPEVSGAALAQKWAQSGARKPHKPRKVKKRKPLWQKALGEIGDLLEDVFD